MLGLSEQVPSRIVFLTDGPARKVKIGQQEIILKRTVPRNMAAAGRKSGTSIEALRFLGEKQVDDQVLSIVRRQIADKDRPTLLRAGVGSRALANPALFERVAEHREIFFRYSWVDYATHKPGTFRLLPPEAHLADWRDDYKTMIGPMFFGDVPEFGEILCVVGEFETTFNKTAPRNRG